ncbi:LamG-like jellyroll fold domain-containing protein [Yinghuangia aomiensis]
MGVRPDLERRGEPDGVEHGHRAGAARDWACGRISPGPSTRRHRAWPCTSTASCRANSPTPPWTAQGPFTIGRATSNVDRFRGSIADVEVFDRVLTADEVRQLATPPKG